jgi:HK97 gp10 family phage protein
MHPKAVLQFEGIEATQKAMLDKAREVNKAALAALQRSAMRIEKTAKTLCPYDTGTLRRSIGVSEPIAERGTAYLVGPHTSYDAYVEFGTRHMPAQPYLRPAYEAEIPMLKEAMHQAVVGEGGLR